MNSDNLVKFVMKICIRTNIKKFGGIMPYQFDQNVTFDVNYKETILNH